MDRVEEGKEEGMNGPISEDDAISFGILCKKAGIELIADDKMPPDEIWLEVDGKPTHKTKIALENQGGDAK